MNPLQETGFYRVNYDRRNWEMIIEQLKRDHTKIHVINRAQGRYLFSAVVKFTMVM